MSGENNSKSEAPRSKNDADPADVESGDISVETQRDKASTESDKTPEENSEFKDLMKWIETHRDDAQDAQEEQAPADPECSRLRSLLCFWEKKKGRKFDNFVTPAEWLSVHINDGLTPAEVNRRRGLCGYNELTAEKKSKVTQTIGYFRGPILYAMELTVLVAFSLGEKISGIIVTLILLFNAAVAYFQESKIVDKLKADIAMKAQVVRGGQEQEVMARDLVPGDIIIIEEGCTIPADAQLICAYDQPQKFDEYVAELRSRESNGPVQAEKCDSDDEDGTPRIPHVGHPILAVDQSTMTGESLAVDKYMTDQLFYTTLCKRGKAYAIVTSGAQASFIGKTASLVTGAAERRHFNEIMDHIGTILLMMVTFSVLIAWAGGLYRSLPIADKPYQSEEEETLFHWLLKLLIIGIPCGLPVVATTTLAVGSSILAKEKAVVQKLTAIESLAGVDILCSDKTGTLTANKLSVREPYVLDPNKVNWMMAVAALACSKKTNKLDPIDKVVILNLKRYPEAKAIFSDGWETKHFTPFDPVSKRVTTVCEHKGVQYTCAKGAPRAVLDISKCTEEQAIDFRKKAKDFAVRGMRSLAVAVKEGDGDWELLGMLSITDPPRPDTAKTIKEAQALGLQVKMLTGDAIAIAKETCHLLGLGSRVFNSEKLLMVDKVPGTGIHEFCERADGFAEVFPHHKSQVVEMLQQRGHLVAMTGDGVNDAPSLKLADCGIAVEGSTEAAQAAADIVFLAPGLSTIVTAIVTARQIFQRLKAYIQYRIALCIHLLVYFLISMLVLGDSMKTTLVAFLALFVDVATLMVAYDRTHFERRPVQWQLPKIWFIGIVLGTLLTAFTLLLRGTLWMIPGGAIQEYGDVHGMLFLEIVLTQSGLIFVTRGFEKLPSLALVTTVLIVDVAATAIARTGWSCGGPAAVDPLQETSSKLGLDGSQTDWGTIISIWLYSAAVIVVMGMIYSIMSSAKWISNIGRDKVSAHDTKIEKYITHFSRLAIEHEKEDKEGNTQTLGRYKVAKNVDDDDKEDI